ncbi:MAG: 23S rRNA (pseudouridine(1915)-N(3))-methyltransferase RlmH [Gammaproteobacteria bacterium]|nr:23S rRNA (pseudouridine(1915)-N(3))-methyltransferase RlmH [Gammaproteobacteria bacterium]
MRLRIITVGSRQPAWVDEAVADYLKRFRAPWRVELVELEAVPRTGGRSADAALEREGERVLSALRDRERVVLLDETGNSLSTRDLATRLETLASSSPDLALLIGGADGHAPSVRARTAESWSLSKMTLPHGLARVMLIEQLYRAFSLSQGHPYHRD